MAKRDANRDAKRDAKRDAILPDESGTSCDVSIRVFRILRDDRDELNDVRDVRLDHQKLGCRGCWGAFA